MSSAIAVSIFANFIIYNATVWSQAPDFGSQSECNSSVVYVLFGTSIKVTSNVFRYTMLVTFYLDPCRLPSHIHLQPPMFRHSPVRLLSRRYKLRMFFCCAAVPNLSLRKLTGHARSCKL